MAEFRMPALGADMEKGTIVTWLKQPGEAVKRGELIAEVETEKGVIEVESFDDGVVDRLVVPEGRVAKVGEVLAMIRGEGEAAAPSPAEKPEKEKAKPQPKPRKTVAAKPEEAIARKPTKKKEEGEAVPVPGRKRVSPAARRRAGQLGVDVKTLTGSGPDGVVTLADVEKAAQAPSRPAPKPKEKAAKAKKAEKAEAPRAAKPAKEGGIDLEAMRHAIAATMARAKREIPHYYVSTTIDMTAVLDFLQDLNKDRSPADRLLPLVLVMKAAALTLKRVPNLNGRYGEEGLEQSEAIHMGTAIALRGGGLVAPAIFDLDQLSLADIMEKLRDLSARVRAGRMRRTELTGGTFTVTSLGEGGVEAMTPIISPPQVGILALGSIVERPWVVDGKVLPRRVMHATVAGDHRASDGRHGARFLELLTAQLQEPEKL